jgi:hypothetical protein
MHDLVLWNEQEQQYRGVTRGGKLGPLAQRVDRQVQSPGPDRTPSGCIRNWYCSNRFSPITYSGASMQMPSRYGFSAARNGQLMHAFDGKA